MKKQKILILIILISSFMVTIGYSSFSKNLGIEDLTVIVREQSDIRITGISVSKVTNNAISTYEEYDRDNISIGIELPNDTSTVTYNIEIFNYGNVFNTLNKIEGLPSNLEYTISGYEEGTIICNIANLCNLGIGRDIKLTIKYKDNTNTTSQTKYSLMLLFDFQQAQTEFGFDYTGGEQVFTIPYNGYYKLETWGAQGGSYDETYYGGYGGYSKGNIYLKSGDIIYINIGGEGLCDENADTIVPGGYNGGGSGYTYPNDNYYSCGGGGATHIASKSGILSSLENYKSDILIVSGAGGGIVKNSKSESDYTVVMPYNGNGGGYIGNKSVVLNGYQGTFYYYGATQSSSGQYETNGYGWVHLGSFGQGGSAGTTMQSSGGGGGYYGGNSGKWSSPGGSGYIGNSSLYNKSMYCYECTESSEYSTKTISTTNVSEEPISGYAKKGNGYSQVTYLGIEKETQYEFGYTGDVQTFTAPVDGYYNIELWGASGGDGYGDGVLYHQNGKGAYTSGLIELKKGTTLYLYVGGRGEDGSIDSSGKSYKDSIGGWNGGGNGNYDHSDDESAGAGGGATDVRLVNGQWDNFDSLKSRIMVAAGGGGGDYVNSSGGNGGGLIGEAGEIHDSMTTSYTNKNSKIGSQFDGYKFGMGNNAIQTKGNYVIAGGGSGYFGGYSLEDKHPNIGIVDSGGASGSSFISGHAGSVAILNTSVLDNIVFRNDSNGIACNSSSSNGYNSLGYNIDIECSKHYSGYEFINTKMIDGSGYNWTSSKGDYIGQKQPDGSTSSGHNGDGYAIISYKKTQYNFDYTGGEQTFIVPKDGIYKLETWGAQGGSVHITRSASSDTLLSNEGVGGFGGYSNGIINLYSNDILFINVGESGSSCKGPYCYIKDSYNGGGACRSYGRDNYATAACGSGGGATSIALRPGLLESLEDYKTDILIVSGGGGGANYCNEWNFASGGHGGGMKGVKSINIGAPHFVNNGGNEAYGGGQTFGYLFGKGKFASPSGYDARVGGGGGYYGGFGSGINGAGGGSGYIGNSLLTNKSMYCYECTESNEESTKTISTTNVSEEPISGYAKMGNGYVRITLIQEG